MPLFEGLFIFAMALILAAIVWDIEETRAAGVRWQDRH